MPLYLYFVVLTNLFFLKLQILTAHLLDQLFFHLIKLRGCLLYTSPSPRD